MLSEMMLFILTLTLAVQVSSLWSSIIIIPMSMLAVILSSTSNSFSGILMVIYILIFISGLLVLIVSISSITPSEQDFATSKLLMGFSLFISVPFYMEYKSVSNSDNLMLSISWLEHQSCFYIFILMLLLTSLTVLTYLLQSFKGLTRSI